MTIHITYFVHGTTTDNEAGIASGGKDVGLSELGEEQSRELRDLTADKKFDVVFCSDLKRSHVTTKIAFEGRFQIIVDKRLKECDYGVNNGKLAAEVDPLMEKMITSGFPEGESCLDVQARVADFLEFLKRDYEGKSVAILAHKFPQLALEVLLNGKTWEQAFADDWRKTKSWQPGWEYILK